MTIQYLFSLSLSINVLSNFELLPFCTWLKDKGHKRETYYNKSKLTATQFVKDTK